MDSGETMEEKKILVCVTGSVAAIKVPEIVGTLKKELHDDGNVKIRVILTEHALHFLPKFNDAAEEHDFEIFRDADEWSAWHGRGDPVLHIELRKWADILVIGTI